MLNFFEDEDKLKAGRSALIVLLILLTFSIVVGLWQNRGQAVFHIHFLLTIVVAVAVIKYNSWLNFALTAGLIVAVLEFIWYIFTLYVRVFNNDNDSGGVFIIWLLMRMALVLAVFDAFKYWRKIRPDFSQEDINIRLKAGLVALLALLMVSLVVFLFSLFGRRNIFVTVITFIPFFALFITIVKYKTNRSLALIVGTIISLLGIFNYLYSLFRRLAEGNTARVFGVIFWLVVYGLITFGIINALRWHHKILKQQELKNEEILLKEE
ncbi:MAG: hypothetical protein FWE37_00785 [Spirochaetaceae bacterium]|nr:hypothetical protein [Spirochaetaceae bacterium]